MKLVREPKNIDFSTKSTPWKEEDLADFRVLLKELKAKNSGRVRKYLTQSNEVRSNKSSLVK